MDDNHNMEENNMGGGARQPILLTPEGQQLFSLLESYINSELPPYTNSKMNEMVNNLAAAEGYFIPTVRTSIVDCLFGRDNNGIISDEQRGLTTTIADTEDWPNEEKRIETALRFFPDIISEPQFHGYYPIQWLAMQEADETYNLKNVSLLPLVIKLGLESQQLFDAEVRGGLLIRSPSGWIPLQRIICYKTAKDNEDNELREECFSTVRNWMRHNHCLFNEDVIEYNLVGKLCTYCGYFSEQRLRYLIQMNPVPLSVPCDSEEGTMLPIHWSTEQEDSHIFRFLLKAGLHYYPETVGFVFGDGRHRHSDGTLYQGTPYQLACKEYGQEKVIHEVIHCITEYCVASASASASTSSSSDIETSLLLSAVSDKSIHFDGLYILLRKDPAAVLLRLQQKLLLLLVGDKEQSMTVIGTTGIGKYTDTDTNTYTDTTNNNNSNNNSGDANTTTTDSTTTSCASNFTSSSTVPSSSSSSDTIAATIVSSTTTTTTTNDNNNDDNNNTRENPTHLTPLPKGTKRKHELVLKK